MFVLVNEHIKKRDDVAIDLEDRGYQFGDGIYEVVRLYDGRPFLMEEHMQRLERSAREMKMDLPLTTGEIQEKIHELIEREQCKSGNVYMQVTRGVSSRTHHFPSEAKPLLTGYIIPDEGRSLEPLKKGIKAITYEDIRWLRCDIKSLNLLGSVFAKQEAIEHGCQEAILHRGDTITEGSSANFFIVKNNVLHTHPSNNLILPGITRAVVIQLAKQLKIEVNETAFQKEDMFDADEAFVTGTTTEVCPVTHIDDRPVGKGTPGEVTRRLQEAFEALIENP